MHRRFALTNCTKFAMKSQLVASSARQNHTELHNKNRLCKRTLTLTAVLVTFVRFALSIDFFFLRNLAKSQQRLVKLGNALDKVDREVAEMRKRCGLPSGLLTCILRFRQSILSITDRWKHR